MEPTDDRSQSRTEIVANAARLLKDAKLLLDNSRHASAFALAVLALEEIGKLVIDIWGTHRPLRNPKKYRSAHLRKQAAVASLLLAKYAIEEIESIDSGPISDELVERVAKAFCNSEAGRFARFVEIGAVDKTKQIAFYRDEWLTSVEVHADQFEASDVMSLFDKARAAIEAVGDPKMIHVGRALYEV